MIEFQTPRGIAGDLCLLRPDTRFNPDGAYKARITLKAEEVANLVEVFKEEAVKAFGPKKASKVTIPGTVTNDDGTVTLTFRSKSRPNVYDSDATPMGLRAVEAARIGDGSTIRINGGAATYEGFGGGVALYLLEIQIIHLVMCKATTGFEPDAEGSFVSQGNGVTND